jgi:branched-chain amino acid transport system substrate-binding protein
MRTSMKMITTGFALSGLIAGLWGCPSPSNNTVGTTSTQVHIGANVPLSGDYAFLGTATRDGATMATEDMEKADPNGPKLVFDWQDNAGDPKTTVTVMQQQYLNPPDIYVSGPTPETFAIKDQVAAKGTPHFVGMFYPFINIKTNNELRALVSYKLSASIFLPYIQTKAPKRVAIAYIQTEACARLYNELVVPALKKQGITQIDIEPFGFGKKDFKDVAVKFQAFKPDIIILDGFQNDFVGLVKALRPLNLIKDGNTLADYDMMDAAKILSPAETEGIRVVAPIFSTRPDQGAIKDFRARFKAKFSKEPDYYDAFSYDMTQIIRDAAKRIKAPATSPQWIEALRATSIEGVTGPLKFDASGDLITPNELGVFHNGQLVPDTK